MIDSDFYSYAYKESDAVALPLTPVDTWISISYYHMHEWIMPLYSLQVKSNLAIAIVVHDILYIGIRTSNKESVSNLAYVCIWPGISGIPIRHVIK